MKRITVAVGLLMVVCCGGCAKYWNSVAADGGMLGSYTADYIVRNDSGGRIMDVWKLKNVIVQSENQSDGWLFQDQQGNAIHLGGDVKVIRLNGSNGDLWNKYVEYHVEFDGGTYDEKLHKAEANR